MRIIIEDERENEWLEKVLNEVPAGYKGMKLVIETKAPLRVNAGGLRVYEENEMKKKNKGCITCKHFKFFFFDCGHESNLRLYPRFGRYVVYEYRYKPQYLNRNLNCSDYEAKNEEIL